jgi:sugar/nucleoside kinase (ribokinase family)
MGAQGSILMHAGEAIPVEGVPVAAVDTTGAGDMYAAGILYGITSGYTWQQAGRLASYAAARIVAQLGARLPSPLTAAELARVL